MLNAVELLSGIAHCTGSETFTLHGIARNMRMTEGVMYVAENAGAHWLTDIVASYLGDKRCNVQPFQVWTLRTALISSSAVISMTDGNSQKAIVQQAIPYTDFPLAEFKLYLVQEGRHWVLMLPSED
jgi:hypothetical protein